MLGPTEVTKILDWDEKLDQLDYFELLGLADQADAGAVKSAYHAFARTFHPDGFLNEDADVQAAVRRIFQRGVEAYRVLTRADLLADYRLALAQGQLRLRRAPGSTLRPPAGAKSSLIEVCESVSAKFHARKADRLINEGELLQALHELHTALRHEVPYNARLAERIGDLEQLMKAQRPPQP